MAKIKIDAEKCKGCGLCVLYCPKGHIKQSKFLNKKGAYPVEILEKGECSGCSFCAIMCPDLCITIYK
jgi:2-oxoglutarate ferredoxin oxidoreductase subunit delta